MRLHKCRDGRTVELVFEDGLWWWMNWPYVRRHGPYETRERAVKTAENNSSN